MVRKRYGGNGSGHGADAPRRKKPGRGRGRAPGSIDQRRRARTPCDAWLACASIAVPACCRIWLRDSCADSLAKSASWIRLRAADRFSEVDDRLATTELKRFWIEPMSARAELIAVSAPSIASIALSGPSTVEMSRSEKPV